MDGFQMAYTVFGGLGIFFLGIRYLSESLQAMAGDLIRKIINLLTTNRILAVLVGTFITCIIQSSSITTVMVVSMVNAGLMNLTQAIGVIFGANIGTTITGWIIAIKVGKYGLLFIALGILPMLFSKNDNWKALGKVLVALGFVFVGLEYMSEAFKPLRTNSDFLSIMQHFKADTYLSVLGCIAIGCALTCVIQSSSAMLGITIALANTGAISFETSMALVLGENIGTTITAFLASIGTNVNAKRAARAHSVFNLLGVFIISLFFAKYVFLINWILGADGNFLSPDGSKPLIATHIAAGHSIFNVGATIIFLPFIKYLAKFVSFITPGDPSKEKTSLITFTATSMAPALGLEQAEKEVESMMNDLKSLLLHTKDYLRLEKDNPKLLDKIVQVEAHFDVRQKDITVFLCNVMESQLTTEQSALGYALIRMSDEIESVSDYCVTISKLYYRTLQQDKHGLSQTGRSELNDFIETIIHFFDQVHEYTLHPETFERDKFYTSGQQINHHADRIRTTHLERIKAGQCSALSGLTYSDMIVAGTRIKNHTVNICEAMHHTKNTTT